MTTCDNCQTADATTQTTVNGRFGGTIVLEVCDSCKPEDRAAA